MKKKKLGPVGFDVKPMTVTMTCRIEKIEKKAVIIRIPYEGGGSRTEIFRAGDLIQLRVGP